MAATQDHGVPVKCECGKTLAFVRNGAIYIKCRNCKRESRVDKKTK